MIRKTWQREKFIRKMDSRNFLQTVRRKVIEENDEIDKLWKRKRRNDEDVISAVTLICAAGTVGVKKSVNIMTLFASR